MALYCLCHKDSDLETEFNGVNFEGREDVPIKVYLGEHSMRCIKTGAQQFIDRSRHYPNVDVYECQNCGARIAKEG